MISFTDLFRTSKKLSKRETDFLNACSSGTPEEMHNLYKATFFHSKLSLEDSYDYLFSVICRNYLPGVKFLLENGMNPNEHKENIKYYFLYSIEKNNIEIVKLLLQHGLHVKQYLSEINEALLEKSPLINMEIVKLLIDSGLQSPDFILKKSFGNSPFKKKDLEMIEYFVSKGKDINQFILPYMNRAIISNDLIAVNKFIDLGACTNNNDNFLYSSFILGDISISKILFLQYPDPHQAFEIINTTNNFKKIQWFQCYIDRYDLAQTLDSNLETNKINTTSKRLKI